MLPSLSTSVPKIISFDCYGTLVQWHEVLRAHIADVLAHHPIGHVDPADVLATFSTHSRKLEAQRPHLLYKTILRQGFASAFRDHGVAYERSREWAQAAAVAQKLDEAEQASFTTRRAHHLCEQAADQLAAGDTAAAGALLRQAAALAPEAPRPAIDSAVLLLRNGAAGEAFDVLAALSERAPLALPIYAATLQQAAVGGRRTGEALALLQRRYAQAPSIDVLEAIIALGGMPALPDDATTGAVPEPRDGYIAHLAHQPSLVAASRWLASETFKHEQFHPQVQRALDQAARPLMRYRCAACGFEAHQYFWHCPGCQAWDSYPPRRVEEL